MNCEICGAFEENLVNVQVEGAFMNLCKACSKYGKASAGYGVAQGDNKKMQLYERSLKDNFSDIIREGSEKKGLSPEELADRIKCSPNDIKKITSGKLLPDGETIRKLERFLDIQLYETESASNKMFTGKDEKLSFGDIVDIKRKK
jgi:uncharacterized protein (TIGR00270 family)